MTFGGRPGHEVCTMTCTSEMSGRASSGTLCSDQMPASTRTSTPMKTRKRLLAHHSITRETMTYIPPVAFRVNQEIGRGHNRVTKFEALEYYEAFVGTSAELHFTRLERSLASRQEHNLTDSRLQHRRSRDKQLASERSVQLDIYEHPGFQ